MFVSEKGERKGPNLKYLKGKLRMKRGRSVQTLQGRAVRGNWQRKELKRIVSKRSFKLLIALQHLGSLNKVRESY